MRGHIDGVGRQGQGSAAALAQTWRRRRRVSAQAQVRATGGRAAHHGARATEELPWREAERLAIGSLRRGLVRCAAKGWFGPPEGTFPGGGVGEIGA
eukprot:6389788-Prymnesium_polylepis.1